MLRREFLKFLGLAPLVGLLGWQEEPKFDAKYRVSQTFVDPRFFNYLTDTNDWYIVPGVKQYLDAIET